MAEREDGGPAFPLFIQGELCDPDCKCGHCEESGSDWHEGMSLRDFFAGLAMQGELASKAHPQFDINQVIDLEKVAEACYEMADAMLRVRGA